MLDSVQPPDGTSSSVQAQPSADEVRAQLARLASSPDFDVPERARKFLRYIVEETLAGRADRIKAYSVGTEVFERDAAFDAQSDPVVRIEAGRLRRALEHYYLVAGRSDPVGIDVPKGGYVPRFTRRAAASAGPISPISPPASDRGADAAPRRRTWWHAAAAAALVAALAGSLWWLAPLQRSQGGREALGPLPGGPTVAVLPFASLGELPETQTYAQGLGEEILSQLARFKELTVLGRETARSIGPGADMGRLHREFGVRYALEGSVRAAKDRLRVTSRLLDAQTGSVLWSQSYDEDLQVRGFFAIQDDIARKVATAIGQPYGIVSKIDDLRLETRAPDDLEAYACSHRFYGYRAALSPAAHNDIRTCLEGAVARHPSYATAWAMLSFVHLDEDRFGFNPRAGSPGATQRALEAARKAVRLEPENARAHQALMDALFFIGQSAEALAIGEQALVLNPNDTELLADLGTRIGQVGDWERGAALLEEALARNPGHSGYYNGVLAHHAYLMRDYRRAERLIRQVSLEKFPLYHFVAAIIFAQLGMDGEAAEARDRFLRMRPDFFERWDEEAAKRNYRPKDAIHLAEGARKAGFPVPQRTAAEIAHETDLRQR